MTHMRYRDANISDSYGRDEGEIHLSYGRDEGENDKSSGMTHMR